MPITDWPEAERPREKLLTRGPQSLSDAELLAIFLRLGVKGKTAVDLARESLSRFGSLRALLAANRHQFCQIQGLGMAKYVQLQATLELSRRFFKENLPRGKILAFSQNTHHYLQACLRDYPYEVFACLFLDTRHRVISFDELFFGTINSASIHPREVVRRALKHNAAAVIFAHNHPSGIAEPSQADRVITQQLQQALSLFDIRVLDHIIIGDSQTTSLAERGLL